MGVLLSSKKINLTIQALVNKIEEHRKLMGYSIEGIVIGMPLMMSGKKGLMADEVNVFIQHLQEALPDIPIVTWDERLSSVQAERAMREANISRKNRTKHVDCLSAVIILQSYLDNRKIREEGLL